MTIYSFGADSLSDVAAFNEGCQDAGIYDLMMETFQDGMGFNEVEVEFETKASLEQLHDVMRALDDGTTMLQTLRACTRMQNSMRRDRSIE